MKRGKGVGRRERERERERERGREREGEKDIQTDRQTDRQRGRENVSRCLQQVRKSVTFKKNIIFIVLDRFTCISTI